MASDQSIADGRDSGRDLDADGGSDAVVCRTPEDFYTPQGRDSIGRHCQRYFDENALTPTELLHSPATSRACPTSRPSSPSCSRRNGHWTARAR
ncbi:hypothetical protein [Azospirillum argentinense]|uniref:hypothetical protein n=1 Tax=Azospirillum argentinense TaxID=2970906 RepID=UPI001FFE34C8|nr:hypothetical protein [Azospirillum argentinense]